MIHSKRFVVPIAVVAVVLGSFGAVALHARVERERAMATGRLELLRAGFENQRRLNAELIRQLRAKQDVRHEEPGVPGAWLCERYRCNEGDFRPAVYQNPEVIPGSARNPLDDPRSQLRRRR